MPNLNHIKPDPTHIGYFIMKKIFIVCSIVLSTLGVFAVCNAKTTSYNITSSNYMLNESDDLEGWTFYMNCKLYYKEDGEWLYYGTFPVYFNRADNKDGCNQWVRFSETGFSPAVYHGNKSLKWPRRVQWQGVYFYF